MSHLLLPRYYGYSFYLDVILRVVQVPKNQKKIILQAFFLKKLVINTAVQKNNSEIDTLSDTRS